MCIILSIHQVLTECSSNYSTNTLPLLVLELCFITGVTVPLHRTDRQPMDRQDDSTHQKEKHRTNGWGTHRMRGTHTDNEAIYNFKGHRYLKEQCPSSTGLSLDLYSYQVKRLITKHYQRLTRFSILFHTPFEC